MYLNLGKTYTCLNRTHNKDQKGFSLDRFHHIIYFLILQCKIPKQPVVTRVNVAALHVGVVITSVSSGITESTVAVIDVAATPTPRLAKLE